METGTNLPATINTEEVQRILVPIPTILEQGLTSLKRATDATQALLDTIEAEGMNSELDKLLLDLIKNLKITKTKLNAKRKPITQFISGISSLFIDIENKIEVLINKSDKHRYDFARKVAELRRQADAAAQKQIAKDKEAAAIEADCKIKLQAYTSDYLAKEQQKLLNLFETSNLDNIDETTKKIISWPAEYSLKHFQAFKYVPMAVHHLPAEADIIAKKALTGYSEFAIHFRKTITDQVAELADRIPSKRVELQAMKAAENDAAEKARLEAIAAQRKAEEQAKIKAEQDKAKADAEAAARAAELQANTNTLFDAQATMSNAPQQTSQVREGYEIEVKAPAGWLAIVSLYFEKEGLKETDMEKMGKKTLNSMKKTVEALAIQGEFIKSPYLIYNETFKAVNR